MVGVDLPTFEKELDAVDEKIRFVGEYLTMHTGYKDVTTRMDVVINGFSMAHY